MNADANLTGNFQFVCRQMGNRRIKILNYRKEKQPGLLERLTEYAGSDAYPFHMPGHKRREIPDGIPGGFPDPYGIDITEIDGFDNLHHAEGILKDAMDEAAAIYGADRSWYLVNGSTCGILSAVFATTENGGKILTARNCHKAVYHAICLNRLEAEYLYPEEITEFGINGGIRAEDVRKALEKDAMRCAGNSGDVRGKITKIQAVLITSPTYEGVVSDIRAIADAAHEYGIPLIVDEAHGAHLEYADQCHGFPKSALEYGADLVIQSLHKTLPSLTQTAVLHLKGQRVRRDRLEQCLQMYQSSSPSYVFMAVMEQCIFEMHQHGAEHMAAFAVRIQKVRERLKNLRNLKLLDRSQIGAHGVFDVDESKLVISCQGKMTGENLNECLRRDYAIEMEMCGADYAVAILTFLDSEEHLERLVAALLVIDRNIGTAGNHFEDNSIKAYRRNYDRVSTKVQQEPGICVEEKKIQDVQAPEICMTPAAAFHAPLECIRLEESAGRISGEFIYLYPPGIPIITPGERMAEKLISQVLYDRDIGLPVQGMKDQEIKYLQVVKEDRATDRTPEKKER